MPIFQVNAHNMATGNDRHSSFAQAKVCAPDGGRAASPKIFSCPAIAPTRADSEKMRMFPASLPV